VFLLTAFAVVLVLFLENASMKSRCNDDGRLIILLGTIVEYRVVAAITARLVHEVPGARFNRYGQPTGIHGWRVLLPQTVGGLRLTIVDGPVWLWSVFSAGDWNVCRILAVGLADARHLAPLRSPRPPPLLPFKTRSSTQRLVDYSLAWFAMWCSEGRRGVYVPLFALEIHIGVLCLFHVVVSTDLCRSSVSRSVAHLLRGARGGVACAKHSRRAYVRG